MTVKRSDKPSLEGSRHQQMKCPYKPISKRLDFIVPLIVLVLAVLACAEKHFGNLRVYSATLGSVGQFYDQTADRILADDVWVFRPNGTFSAVVNVDGQKLTLSGKYGGDDAGKDFFFSIDTNNDGKYDDNLYASNDFSYIEWRREGGILKYIRIQ